MMKNVLNVMNYIFAVTFTVEMLLKIFGMGFVGYFTNLWNCLDFFIVAVYFFSWKSVTLKCPLCYTPHGAIAASFFIHFPHTLVSVAPSRAVIYRVPS